MDASRPYAPTAQDPSLTVKQEVDAQYQPATVELRPPPGFERRREPMEQGGLAPKAHMDASRPSRGDGSPPALEAHRGRAKHRLFLLSRLSRGQEKVLPILSFAPPSQ